MILQQTGLPNGCTGWKLTVNPRNTGYIANFRQALALCSGDLIFLSDQDDCWHPDKIERMAAFFEQSENIQALACSYEAIDAEGKPLSDVLPLYSRAKKWGNGSLHRIRGSVFYSNIAQGCRCFCSRRPATWILRRR